MMLEQLTLIEDKKTDRINHVAKPYTGIYAMHKYWSKKPYNVVRDFILRYTNKGEIVLDPFCGSGISIIESIVAERKVVGIDINPSAIFITKQTIRKIPTKLMQKEFKKIESDIKDEINSFYAVRRNGRGFIGTHFIWKDDKLMEVWYKTKEGGRKKIVEKPTERDTKLASSFSYEKIPYYYPEKNFFHNSRINTSREKHIYEIFTPRNLTALSLLMNRIEEIEKSDMRELFKFCFTASVGQASKMVFVIRQRKKSKNGARKTRKREVGSWVIGYWIPDENFEINVWNCFENRCRRIMRAKKKQEKACYSIKKAEIFKELLGSRNLLLLNEPAQKALGRIPDDSIDYVVTDPPHGNRQPYLELSMMWNEWLKKKVNYEDEIVISESKDRNKNIHNYYKLLYKVFVEIERVLKPYRFFSLMFNSLDDETWINLVQKMNSLSFELGKVETLEYSAKSVVQDTRRAGLKTDFILTFRKTPGKIRKDIELISIRDNREYIMDSVEAYLEDNDGNGSHTYQILNYLVSRMLQKGEFFRLSEVLSVLKKDFVREGNEWIRRKI